MTEPASQPTDANQPEWQYQQTCWRILLARRNRANRMMPPRCNVTVQQHDAICNLRMRCEDATTGQPRDTGATHQRSGAKVGGPRQRHLEMRRHQPQLGESELFVRNDLEAFAVHLRPRPASESCSNRCGQSMRQWSGCVRTRLPGRAPSSNRATYTHTSMRLHTHACTCACTHTHARAHAHMHAHTHACTWRARSTSCASSSS